MAVERSVVLLAIVGSAVGFQARLFRVAVVAGASSVCVAAGVSAVSSLVVVSCVPVVLGLVSGLVCPVPEVEERRAWLAVAQSSSRRAVVVPFWSGESVRVSRRVPIFIQVRVEE